MTDKNKHTIYGSLKHCTLSPAPEITHEFISLVTLGVKAGKIKQWLQGLVLQTSSSETSSNAT